jgi:AraC-like DNA-binding protein
MMSAALLRPVSAPGLSISVSRREVTSATADVLRRFSPLGSGGLQIALPAQDVTAAKVQHHGAQPLALQIQSDGQCGFNYCLYGGCLIDDFSRLIRYCPDTPAVYNGGVQKVAIPMGVRLLSVGLSGTPTALSDFLGIDVEDLIQIIDPISGGSTDFSAAAVSTGQQLRRSAMRLAENLVHAKGDRLGLLRAKAGALDFGLYMLEALEGSRGGGGKEYLHADSVHRRLDQVAQYLEGEACGPESIDCIAARFGFSRSAFDQAFRARFGCSPGAFRIDCRLRAVSRLLESTDADITSLAMEFGFSSSSNLTRSFRNRYGLTPTAYRDRHRM